MKKTLLVTLALLLVALALGACGAEAALGTEENPIQWGLVPSGESDRVLTGFETQHGLPLVKMGDKEFFCMGVILPYTKELHSFMESIDKKHRWALFSDMTKFSKNIERAIGN